MERVLTARPRQLRVGVLTARRSFDAGSMCGFLLPLVLISYLGVRGGGYDTVISSQVGIVAWWLILLLFGMRLVRVRITRGAAIFLALLVAYGAWTALSLIWTESAESTMTDVSLMLLYVGLAVLALNVRGRDVTRFMLYGLGSAIVAIAALALLSRLHFTWFAASDVVQALPGAARKLAYPLNYWNALATLMALGLPVLLYCACAARTILGRALAAAAIPILALCAFLTVSRGGTIISVVAVLAFLALAPERLPKLAIAIAAGAGSALLIAAANQRTAVRDGLRTTLAAHQGNQLIVIALVVAVGVGLLVAAIVLVERHVERPRLLVVSRQRMTALSGAGALVAVLVFVVAGGPGFLTREWRQFKTPTSPATANQSNALDRLANVTGNGRYQLWQAAVREANTKPLTGTGAGTFRFWWARDGVPTGGFVIDAHSLYIQALGELGYPGLALIAAFIAWILGCGVWRVVRGRDPARRLAVAAATAGSLAFALSAAVEWIWFIPVLPAALIVLAAVIHGGGESSTGPPEGAARAKRHRRGFAGAPATKIIAAAGATVTALAAIIVIALPMAATASVRDSQSLVRAGNLTAALAHAVEATKIQPYAATPWLQEALVREQAGDLRGARTDALRAVAAERTNWQTWLTLSGIDARAGHSAAALADYRRARALNPNSPLFENR